MATADVTTATINQYEAARLRRVEECKRRFEDLGISKISKSLSEATKAIKKSTRNYQKPKSLRMIGAELDPSELRRSSRPRTAVMTYSEEITTKSRPSRKRSNSSTWKSYLARPVDEVRLCSSKERENALMVAEDFWSNLHSKNPSFVKSMVRSHVYSCFWLGLPTKFCKAHLQKGDLHMVLEDDKGLEWESLYIGSRRGLSGGWRAFALDHNLDDGDALVFERVESARFKIYIFKVRGKAGDIPKPKAPKTLPEKAGGTSLTNSKNARKASSNASELISGRLQREGKSATLPKNVEGTRLTRTKKVTGKNVTSSQEVQPGSKSKSKKRAAVSENAEASVSEEVEPEVDDGPKSRKRGTATKTKIYIFKVRGKAGDIPKPKAPKTLPEKAGGTSLTNSKNARKASSNASELISGRLQREGKSATLPKNVEGTRLTRTKKVTGKNVTSSQEVQPGSKSKSKKRAAVSENVEASVSEEVEPEVDDGPKSRKRGTATKTKVSRRNAF